MNFIRSRDARMRGSRVKVFHQKGQAEALPTHSEIIVNTENTLIGWKIEAMVRGDHGGIDELAMLWSLNRLAS